MSTSPSLQSSRNLYEIAALLNQARRPFAIITVLKAVNSTPVPAGAKAIVQSRGKLHGTVGGGLVEAVALRHAKEVLRSGKPVLFDFDLRGPGVHEASPICGGSMRLLVAPGAVAHPREYERAAEALVERKPGRWLTTIRTHPELSVNARFIRSKIHQAGSSNDVHPRNESPQLIQHESNDHVQLFTEPLLPNPALLIVGGGHVSRALAAQADLLGFDIFVFEDRPEFANPRLFPPGTRSFCGPVPQHLAKFPVDKNTFIVLVSRNHQQDTQALRACIHSPAAYIGMIGSRRKVPMVRREFLSSGWATADEFQRIYAPIGLDLGAVTVPEIATSITAQLIAVRRNGTAAKMPLK